MTDGWRLLDTPAELSEGEFAKEEWAAQRAEVGVSDKGVIKVNYLEGVAAGMAEFDFDPSWDLTTLVSWLERNLPEITITPDEKAAWLMTAVTYLEAGRGFSREVLVLRKHRVREALERKIAGAKRAACRQTHLGLMAAPEQFSAAGEAFTVFRYGSYAYNTPCASWLPKHFFPQIGDLKSDGEEFDCALFLATQFAEVRSWVRNVPRKPSSFSLQTSRERFYPDFICQLHDGRLLVVEYKNARDWDLPEHAEDRAVGELWEKRSGGKALFIMPKGPDWPAIRAKVASPG